MAKCEFLSLSDFAPYENDRKKIWPVIEGGYAAKRSPLKLTFVPDRGQKLLLKRRRATGQFEGRLFGFLATHSGLHGF